MEEYTSFPYFNVIVRKRSLVPSDSLVWGSLRLAPIITLAFLRSPLLSHQYTFSLYSAHFYLSCKFFLSHILAFRHAVAMFKMMFLQLYSFCIILLAFAALLSFPVCVCLIHEPMNHSLAKKMGRQHHCFHFYLHLIHEPWTILQQHSRELIREMIILFLFVFIRFSVGM